MSAIDDKPPITATIEPGDYAIYAAAQSLGIDQYSLGENLPLSDADIARRRDVEWYRLLLVPGKPETEGRLLDSPTSDH